MQEARELANDPSTEYSAAPLEVCDAFIFAYTQDQRLALPPLFITLGRYLCMRFLPFATYNSHQCGL